MTYSSPQSKQIYINVYPIKRTKNGKLYESLCCVIPKPFTTKLGINANSTVKFTLNKNKLNLEKADKPEDW